jgi:hypothetical protein
LSELVPRVYPSNEPEDLKLVRAIGWWDRHVPPRIARNARPAKLRRGTLVIHAVTSAWTHEVSMSLPQWLGGLERAVPGLDTRKVRVQVGPLPPRPASPKPITKIAALAVTELPEDVAASLSRIHDDRVREAIANAAAQSLALRSRARTRTR